MPGTPRRPGSSRSEEYGEEWLEMSLVPVGEVYWAQREEETEVGVKE